jgi:hypothetical protein
MKKLSKSYELKTVNRVIGAFGCRGCVDPRGLGVGSGNGDQKGVYEAVEKNQAHALNIHLKVGLREGKAETGHSPYQDIAFTEFFGSHC